MSVAPMPSASASAFTSPVSTQWVQPLPRVELAEIEISTPKPSVINAELVDNTTGDFNGDFAADARTTNTLDWSCIRNAESHDNYKEVSGAYGILTSTWLALGMTGVPGDASVRVQDHFALRLFALNRHRFAGSWNDACTMGEGLG